jgi:hypothetical protein
VTEKTSLPVHQFPSHLFWSYKKDAILPTYIVVKQVVTYGELEDLQLLCNMLPANQLKSILNKINENPKRVNFIQQILLQP